MAAQSGIEGIINGYWVKGQRPGKYITPKKRLSTMNMGESYISARFIGESLHNKILPIINAIDNDQNVMREHAAFFDRNNDGVVYPWETYQGIRAIGGGFLVSLAGGILINLGLSGLTRPGKWFPNLLFPIELENITLAKHGSDSDTYDSSGRFVPSKFEEIFSKYARTDPDSLTKDELNEFIKRNRDPLDYFGQIAALGEWNLLYSLAKDEEGLLQKETIRGVFDGSLFVKLEEKNNLSKKKHM